MVNLGLFPANNIWNVPVDAAPLHPKSAQWMDIINGHSGHPLHADFGTVYAGHLNGIPYNVVGNATPLVKVVFNPAANYSSESDPIPAAGLPIPSNVVVEGDPPPVDMTGDRHLILVDTDNHVLHELFAVVRQADGSFLCAQYSRWDLTLNNLRTDGLTSADAGGLPIMPGLVRWDEIQAGVINHALRFTLSLTHGPHLWPGRHDANSGGVLNPPFGMRVRLKAAFNIAGYSLTNRIILTALKKYGMFMADNGGDWFVSGAPNPAFDDADLHLLGLITPNTAFEVVDTSSWIVGLDSAAVNTVAPPPPPPPPPPPVVVPPTQAQIDQYTADLAMLRQMRKAVAEGAKSATDPDFIAQQAVVKTTYRKEFLNLF